MRCVLSGVHCSLLRLVVRCVLFVGYCLWLFADVLLMCVVCCWLYTDLVSW